VLDFDLKKQIQLCASLGSTLVDDAWMDCAVLLLFCVANFWIEKAL